MERHKLVQLVTTKPVKAGDEMFVQYTKETFRLVKPDSDNESEAESEADEEPDEEGSGSEKFSADGSGDESDYVPPKKKSKKGKKGTAPSSTARPTRKRKVAWFVIAQLFD